jgi:hypothetical protein
MALNGRGFWAPCRLPRLHLHRAARRRSTGHRGSGGSPLSNGRGLISRHSRIVETVELVHLPDVTPSAASAAGDVGKGEQGM